MSNEMLRLGFVGAGAANFGSLKGPWDHATRIEKIGGVQVSLKVIEKIVILVLFNIINTKF